MLAEKVAIYAENTHIALPQRVAVYIDHAAIGNIRGHGVTADSNGELRRLRNVLRNGDIVEVLAEHRGGIACRRRVAVKRDDPGLLLFRPGLLHLIPVGAQCVHHGAHGLAALEGQAPVLPQQRLLGGGQAPAALPVAVPEQNVRLCFQTVKQPQHDVLLRKAQAVFIIADSRGRDTQPRRQLHRGEPQLAPPEPDLFAKTHGKSASYFAFRRFPTTS